MVIDVKVSYTHTHAHIPIIEWTKYTLCVHVCACVCMCVHVFATKCFRINLIISTHTPHTSVVCHMCKVI